MAKDNFDYSQKKRELEEVMGWFEGDQVTIEQSIEKYEEAKKIINRKNKVPLKLVSYAFKVPKKKYLKKNGALYLYQY